MYLHKLHVYNKSLNLAIQINKICQSLALKNNIIDQIMRSSVSISSNIAEGIARGTPKEFIRFLHIARGSAYETYTQFIILNSIASIPQHDYMTNHKELLDIIKMLSGLINKIKNSYNKPF